MDPDNHDTQQSHTMSPAATTSTSTPTTTSPGRSLPPRGKINKGIGNWSAYEKKRLQTIVKEYGNSTTIPWSEIAMRHGTRDAKQCRERWDNHEKYTSIPPITPQWSAYFLEQASKPNGHTWAAYSRISGYPENKIKNHYYQETGKRKQKMQHVQRRQRVRSSTREANPSSHHTVPVAPFSPHHDSLAPLMHTRCLSNASDMPSLASDNGSDVDSPRLNFPLLEPRLTSPTHFQLPIPHSAGVSPKMEALLGDMYRHHRSTSQPQHTAVDYTSGVESHPISPIHLQGREWTADLSYRPSHNRRFEGFARGSHSSSLMVNLTSATDDLSLGKERNLRSHAGRNHQSIESNHSVHITVGFSEGSGTEPSQQLSFSMTDDARTHRAPARDQRPRPVEPRMNYQEARIRTYPRLYTSL